MEMNNDRLLTAVLQGRHPGPESSIGKLYWANWHRDFGELLVGLMGADGTLDGEVGAPMNRMVHTFLNSRAETIYGGANEIQRNILAERALGLPK
jgi:alkylation response protein AidB-like acyl-CoA dehydrogenase